MSEELDYSKLNGTNCYNAQGEEGDCGYKNRCKHVLELQQENQQLKENIGKAINYIDQVIGYKPCAREIDEELNTLIGILRGGNNG